jgi:penicillin-binding protein 1A
VVSYLRLFDFTTKPYIMRRSVKIFWRIFFGGFIAFVLLVCLASWGVFGPMPSLKKLENPSILQATEVFAEILFGKR